MIRFDIDAGEIRVIARELSATEDQIKFAMSRALRRTSETMRKRARPALAKGLDLKRANVLRKRLKELKVKRKSAGEVAIWFGLNDLPAGSFKGRPKQTRAGVDFRGHSFPGAFLATMPNGKRGIFRRKGAERLAIYEETIGIEDQAMTILEDEVYADLPEVFMRHFANDLRGRVLGFGRQQA